MGLTDIRVSSRLVEGTFSRFIREKVIAGLSVELAEENAQVSLRSRETFWDIQVAKMDSILDRLLVPWPSCVHVVPSLPQSEATTQHSRK